MPGTFSHPMSVYQEIDPMARFSVTHNQAIWETTIFEVEVPEPLPEDYEDSRDWIIENCDELVEGAIEADTATIEQGDRVESLDSDLEIRDEAGNKVYSDVDGGHTS
jgi:hypothetical protein